MSIYNVAASISPRDLANFSHYPQRIVLHPPALLYRFGTMVSAAGTGGNQIFASPWWVPEKTFQAITRTATRTNSPISSVARSRLAVATPWNPTMDWLVVVQLKLPVYAWVGPAKPQPLDGANRAVLLLGNFDQAFVPGLSP